jgi:streptogramin lyase
MAGGASDGVRAVGMLCAFPGQGARRESALGRSAVRFLLGATISLFTLLSLASSAWAIDEFPLTNPCSAAPSGGTCEPGGITAGPDGNLWFTEENGNRLGRITPGGAITEFTAGLSSGAKPVEITTGPFGLWFSESGASNIGLITTAGAITEVPVGATTDGIAAGPDGHIWFTEPGANRVGRRRSDNGQVTHYTLPNGGSDPGDIVAGPDNRMWFTEGAGNRIGAINPFAADIGGSLQEYDESDGLSAGSDPAGITSSAGALWFTEFAGNRIGRISTTGAISEFPIGSNAPSGIATGSDGALWFTETSANRIGRITPAGSLTNEFALPTPNSQPGDIAAGPDGALWFTELVGNKIGRIAPAPPAPIVTLPPPAAPAASKKKRCKVPKLKRLTVKKARKKLKRAGCKYKIRGKGRFHSSKPKAGRTTSGTVIVKFKKKRARR